MIRGLAIETSGRLSSVALVQDGATLAERSFEHGLKHAAEIVPRINQLLEEAGWRCDDIAEIYVSEGPGSFTGLRIGITLAKTLAYAMGARVVAVPSLAVLAKNAPAEARELILVLDAKRDQIFTSRMTRSAADDEWAITEPAHLDSLSAIIARAARPVHLLGEGLPFHKQFVPTDDASIISTPPELWRASARAVADIGHRMARSGQFSDTTRLVPLYVRKPEAEEKLDGP